MVRGKGKHFADYVHPTYRDVKCEIRIFKDGIFSSEFEGHTVSNKALDALKRELTQLIDDLYEVRWYPVMEVKIAPSVVAHVSGSVDIRLSTSRKWVGRYNKSWYEANFRDPSGDQFKFNNPAEFKQMSVRTDKPYNQRHFSTYGMSEIKDIPGDLPHYHRSNDGYTLNIILSYNQKTWDTLQQLQETLHTITRRILELVWEKDSDQKVLGILFQPDMMLPAIIPMSEEGSE